LEGVTLTLPERYDSRYAVQRFPEIDAGEGRSMESHVRALGILHIVLSVLGLVGALILLLVFGAAAGIVGASGDEDAQVAVPIVGGLGVVLSVVVLIVSIPGLVAGIGLVRLRPWARVLGSVVSAMNLIHVPLGTAVGIYGLWVLLSVDAQRLFARPAAAGPAPAAIS
jgi:hypothetical protein